MSTPGGASAPRLAHARRRRASAGKKGVREARRAGRGVQEAKRLLSEAVARRRLAPAAGEHALRFCKIEASSCFDRRELAFGELAQQS